MSSSLLDCEPQLLDDVRLKSSAKSPVVEEIKGFLRVLRDGRVDRSSPHVQIVPPSYPSGGAVNSKDEVIDAQSGVWARIYVPADDAFPPPPTPLLPMVVYFHGGGFCMGSAAWSIYDAFLSRLAMEANCIVISVDYRLAPEHRLPAQYEDGIKTLQWLRRQAAHKSNGHGDGDEKGVWCDWVRACGDFGRCFLAGDSAGANIVHNLAMAMAMARGNSSDGMLAIEGAILIQPFFGGMDVLRWEEETCDPALPRKWIDVYWRLALPVGANRNHPACNPLPALRRLQLQGGVQTQTRMLVCVGEDDVLRERNMAYYSALVEAGMNVRNVVFEGVGHAFHVLRPHSPRLPHLINLLSHFINTTTP